MKTKIPQKTFVAPILVLVSLLLLGTSQSQIPLALAPGPVQEAWVARYNGPGNLDDGGHAIAGDSSGNVYVTGGSHGSGTDLDYATIKYTSAGQQQWVARYNGLASGWDRAAAIAGDSSGNVYVTGQSLGLGTGLFDYATIKYDSAGQEQWVARYSLPASDLAVAIAVDGSGNVYVTGRSTGLGTFPDYATVKYDSAGQEQWVARYNGPGNGGDFANGIAVDASGNVYVTGGSDDSDGYDDYATIKYDSAGQEQWVARYNSSRTGDDHARAIALDGSGNVYVMGFSNKAHTYDYATVKYDSAGQEQWVARYNGPGNGDDDANAIAVDGSGNVYVTGQSTGLGTGYDYATIKYDSAGQEQWVARLPASSIAVAIAVDGSGNVYVTGRGTGLGPLPDYATVKYDSAGQEQWVARYNGPGNGGDFANAIAVDASGNVYVTGGSDDSDGYFDYATIKYNSAGQEQWVARYNRVSHDYAWAIALDGSGNVYVTGESINTNDDYATIKYDSAGQEQWVARYNSSRTGDDHARAIALDGSGNVYVMGFSNKAHTYDYATVKYNSAGQEQWVARYNGPGNGNEEVANTMVVDGSGNVYVTGASPGRATGFDYATVKYVQNPTPTPRPHPTLPH